MIRLGALSSVLPPRSLPACVTDALCSGVGPSGGTLGFVLGEFAMRRESEGSWCR